MTTPNAGFTNVVNTQLPSLSNTAQQVNDLQTVQVASVLTGSDTAMTASQLQQAKVSILLMVVSTTSPQSLTIGPDTHENAKYLMDLLSLKDFSDSCVLKFQLVTTQGAGVLSLANTSATFANVQVGGGNSATLSAAGADPSNGIMLVHVFPLDTTHGFERIAFDVLKPGA